MTPVSTPRSHEHKSGGNKTGTSFAAAIVSGGIANLMHVAPDRTADEIEKALAATAKDLGPKGRDNDFGYGLLDIKAAGAAKE